MSFHPSPQSFAPGAHEDKCLTMRGIGFFEILATLPSESEAADRLTGGLLAYCVAERARRTGRVSAQAVEYARRHVGRLTDLVLRTRLLAIIRFADPEHCPAGEWPQRVDVQLLAYAVELHHTGYLAAAIDVLRVVAQGRETETDPELRMHATRRAAFASRVLKRFDEARMWYDKLGGLAEARGNTRMSLEAALGYAKLAIDRGNFPEGERLLMEVMRRAISAGDRAIVAKAHIDLAHVAGVRGEPRLVVWHSFAALPDLEGELGHDRALRNIAFALRELGRSKTAGHVARYVAQSAREAEQRFDASVLLYHLAIDEGRTHEADDYRRALALESPAPGSLAGYYEAVVRDLASRRRWVEAECVLFDWLKVAEAAGMSESVIRADRAFDDIRAHRIPVLYDFRPAPLDEDAAGASVHTALDMASIEEALSTLCAV